MKPNCCNHRAARWEARSASGPDRQRLQVVTCLEGRSRDSIGRRDTASMNSISRKLAGTDFFLSIVPPGEAEGCWRSVCAISRARRETHLCRLQRGQSAPRRRHSANRWKPPVSLCRCGRNYRRGRRTGCRAPLFYLSGEKPAKSASLVHSGSPAKVLDDPLAPPRAQNVLWRNHQGADGARSVMISQPRRAGRQMRSAVMADSQPMLLAWFERQIPDVQQGYRWVAEMEEVARVRAADAAAQELFIGSAHLYERLAADFAACERGERPCSPCF